MGDPVRVPLAASAESPAPPTEAALHAPATNGPSSAAEPGRASVPEPDASASSTRAYRWLAVAASVLLVLAAVALTLDRRLETRLAAQRAQALELHIRAHRLALDAQTLTADAQALQRLQDSGQRFAAALAAFEHPSMQAARAASVGLDDAYVMLASLRKQWNALEPSLQSLGGQREAMQEARVRQQAIAAHTQPLATLLQRLSRSATEVRLEPGLSAALRQVESDLDPARLAYLPVALAAPNPEPALFARLREQMTRTAAALATLLRERPPSPVAENAEALREALQPVLSEIERLQALASRLTRTRASAHDIASATDALANDAATMVRSFPPASFAVSRWMWAGMAAGVAAFGCLLWILKAMLADAERRAAASLQSAARSRQANQRTQDAILRLLDELSRLAHGDLTVRADVADEVTGAVADAINYAVGELRRLVLGIHRAADRLAEACTEAQELSGELLNASQRQAQGIVDTAATVAAVSRSAAEISARAAASAKEAETSLQAAQQGSASVRRSVAGIEVIRQQVQETAKRIKRLGESSQEIGESVDLIGEISERSHVLALNAAIQANAANVGRGFSLVADEVRSLAERSAHAARQIDALVKAIQVETQDATSAMERSTARVVEQTQLARSAGQALKRIDEHAHSLALLTEAISTATQAQSEAARGIDTAMAEVAGVSELAAEATRKSADRSAQLAALARELKELVAGFKAS